MESASPKRHETPDAQSVEVMLRAEIAELRSQLDRQKASNGHGAPPVVKPPSRTRLWSIALLVLVLAAVGFVAGYMPRHKREGILAAEARTSAQTLPIVNVAVVERASGKDNLVLPGSLQADAETPVLARASGYVKRRLADIGDRVTAGQVLAEIEAPELDQQMRQVQATVAQAQAALEQSMAGLHQGNTNLELARVTAQRWSNLTAKGAVSRQENDTYQAQYQAQIAGVQALEKAVAAARSNVTAAEANLARLNDVQSYRSVRAPFAGIITLRNVDAGTFVAEGSTLLYRVAQTGRMRIYVNVPQNDAASVRVGQTAALRLAEFPGRGFPALVARTSGSLDPATRTLLTEVHAANPTGELMPGMYAQVDMAMPRREPPLLVPSDALIVRGDGPQVALVGPGDLVHYQRIQVGRDFGDRVEVLGGLEDGQRVVVNASDSAREGARVNPVVRRKAAPAAGPGGAPPGPPSAGGKGKS